MPQRVHNDALPAPLQLGIAVAHHARTPLIHRRSVTYIYRAPLMTTTQRTSVPTAALLLPGPRPVSSGNDKTLVWEWESYYAGPEVYQQIWHIRREPSTVMVALPDACPRGGETSAKILDRRAEGNSFGRQHYIVELTSRNGCEIVEVDMSCILEFVSPRELERFENGQFEIEAQAEAIAYHAEAREAEKRRLAKNGPRMGKKPALLGPARKRNRGRERDDEGDREEVEDREPYQADILEVGEGDESDQIMLDMPDEGDDDEDHELEQKVVSPLLQRSSFFANSALPTTSPVRSPVRPRPAASVEVEDEEQTNIDIINDDGYKAEFGHEPEFAEGQTDFDEPRILDKVVILVKPGIQDKPTVVGGSRALDRPRVDGKTEVQDKPRNDGRLRVQRKFEINDELTIQDKPKANHKTRIQLKHRVQNKSRVQDNSKADAKPEVLAAPRPLNAPNALNFYRRPPVTSMQTGLRKGADQITIDDSEDELSLPQETKEPKRATMEHTTRGVGHQNKRRKTESARHPPPIFTVASPRKPVIASLTLRGSAPPKATAAAPHKSITPIPSKPITPTQPVSASQRRPQNGPSSTAQSFNQGSSRPKVVIEIPVSKFATPTQFKPETLQRPSTSQSSSRQRTQPTKREPNYIHEPLFTQLDATTQPARQQEATGMPLSTSAALTQQTPGLQQSENSRQPWRPRKHIQVSSRPNDFFGPMDKFLTPKQLSQPQNVSDGAQSPVESIIEHRKRDGEKEYYVKRSGDELCEWVKERDLYPERKAVELLAMYNKRQNRHRQT